MPTTSPPVVTAWARHSLPGRNRRAGGRASAGGGSQSSAGSAASAASMYAFQICVGYRPPCTRSALSPLNSGTLTIGV